MVSQKDATIIGRADVPAGRIVATYTFLRDMGKTLEKDKAIRIKAADATEAKKIQNRWRAYFKKEARTRKDVRPDGTVMVFLWKES